MLLLISDANILIDIEDGNLTSVLFKLPYEIAVPDILFDLELREKHGYLLKLGLKVKILNDEYVMKTESFGFKYSRTSLVDNSALALAMQEKCPLLSGDKDLRLAAKNEGVEVHGTLWIIEQFLNLKIIEQAQARSSFDSMKSKGRRLPWGDVEKLLKKWQFVEC